MLSGIILKIGLRVELCGSRNLYQFRFFWSERTLGGGVDFGLF